MRRLIARYIIRRLWYLLADKDDNAGYGTLGIRFNICSCIATVLGGHNGWFPRDVEEDFSARRTPAFTATLTAVSRSCIPGSYVPSSKPILATNGRGTNDHSYR